MGSVVLCFEGGGDWTRRYGREWKWPGAERRYQSLLPIPDCCSASSFASSVHGLFLMTPNTMGHCGRPFLSPIYRGHMMPYRFTRSAEGSVLPQCHCTEAGSHNSQSTSFDECSLYFPILDACTLSCESPLTFITGEFYLHA